MPANLDTYIANAREKKVSDEKIKAALLSAGWEGQQILLALQKKSTNDDALPPPPPPPIPHVGMWTGFLYILFFIALYVLATSIGGIFHQMIDKMIPDIKTTTDYVRSNNSLVRGFVAAVIVSYPIFFILALVLKKQLVKQPIIRNLRSRKLLIYITLVGTFLIMLCHIIYTIYSFLSGTLTSNALGHLFVTFLVAGSIFGYFINEVKYDRKTQ